jgi:hypothetical protein
MEVFKDLPVGVAVIDDEQLTAGQAGAAGHGWRSPGLIIGPLKQNKIKKSKGFAFRGYRGREYFAAGRPPGGLRDGGSPTGQKKSPREGGFFLVQGKESHGKNPNQ